jgi:hypothetical protein
MYDLAAENEPAFRMYLRATMDQWLAHDAQQDRAKPLRRGGRRLEMLDVALQELRPRLGARKVRRLRIALATLSGIEALIVARDICGATNEQAKDAFQWAVASLVESVVKRDRRQNGREG